MSMDAPTSRPFTVTLVAILIVVSAIYNIVIGIMAILATFGDNPTLNDISGAPHQIPGYFLWINGLLSIILGLLYFWLTRMTLIGSATAYLLITMLAIINVVFALFQMPFGWGAIIANLIVLGLINTARAKAWFTQFA